MKPVPSPENDGLMVPCAHPAPADHSRFVQRVRRRYGELLPRLQPGLPDTASMNALLQSLRADGRDLAAALRVMRHIVMERLAVLDIEQGASLQDICASVTQLGEVALEHALAAARAELDERGGPPLDANGQPIAFWILGMGKFGARELNISSDIDLIYVYDDEGQTERSGLSAHEYFARVAKRLQALVGDVTDDGFVFRMDLALRPNGMSGPPAVSLTMLEEYFLIQGREWERFAWLKSRVVAPRSAVDSGNAKPMAFLVSKFVYRKYLDYGVFQGLRQLHGKIRDEAQRRCAGRPERANDVKLARGGIREIEFIVQLLLVVRGGQFPEIRTRSTLRGLSRLVAASLLDAATAHRLAQCYVFLRRVEHRIQFLDDQQTHLLPTGEADLDWIARSLGDAPVSLEPCDLPADASPPLAPTRNARELMERFGEVREFVAGEFDALLRDPAQDAGAGGDCTRCGGAPLAIDSEALWERLPGSLAPRVREWSLSPRVAALRDDSRVRLGRLVKRAAADVDSGAVRASAVLDFLDWLEPLLRRESYLAMLDERPAVLERLLRLLDLARWPKRYLMQHPAVIDELADSASIDQRFDRAAFQAELQSRHEAWERAGEADEEILHDALRRAQHAEVFRTLVRDIEGRLTVEQVADDLSALADAVLEVAIRWAWAGFAKRHRPEPAFAVIAYGKLGGKELGYGGDLDVVFLFDDEDEEDADRAQEIYSAFVRRLVQWLTVRTRAGELYEIDTALRPNGNSGMLVTSVGSYMRYQEGRGSNTAWSWEHQALTRARWCAGDPAVGERFEATRKAVLTAPRDAAALRREIAAMREKVMQAHPVREGRFDVKHSDGGMMDAEFAVQALVLTESAAHPELIPNLGNIALMRRAQDAGLLPEGVGPRAADAYRQLRRVQHRARLNEESTQVEGDALTAEREAIQALWRAVFG